MVRNLGVNCSSSEVYLALADEQVVVDGMTERLQPPVGLETGEALVEFVDSVTRVLRETRPDLVTVLLPERWSAVYTQHLNRATMETLVRLAAAQEEIPVQVLARATLRSRLGLPRKGKLDEHLDAAGPPVGTYWTTGRGVAALAALTGDE